VPKKQVSQDRKARIAEMQRLEKARENRVRIQIIAAAATLLLVLGAAISYAVVDAGKKQPDVAITDHRRVSLSSLLRPDHHGQGRRQQATTSDPAHPRPTPRGSSTTRCRPSNGPHFAEPVASNGINFYTAADRPKMEVLVHNLEHGYTILWYDASVSNAQKAELEQVAKLANKLDPSSGKFIVSAWDSSYGQLPVGKKFALSHWSATIGADKTTVASQAGHRQLCGGLSGAVVKAFVQEFPRTSAPEPGGA